MVTITRNDLAFVPAQIVQTRGRGANADSATKRYFAPVIEDINQLVKFIGLEGSVNTLQAVVRTFGRSATLAAIKEHGELTDTNSVAWWNTYQDSITKATDGATTKAQLLADQAKLTQLIVAIASKAMEGISSVTLADGTSYAIPQNGPDLISSAMLHMAELSIKAKALAKEIEEKSRPRKDDDDESAE